MNTDFATGEVQCNDPCAYLAKTKKKYGADNLSYHDVMTGEHAKEYQKAMCVEIKQLALKMPGSQLIVRPFPPLPMANLVLF